MLARAKRICSNISLYNVEVKRLKQIFHLNGYSHMIFDKIVLKFYSKQSNMEEGNDKDEILFLKIPYLGNDSRNFFKECIYYSLT